MPTIPPPDIYELDVAIIQFSSLPPGLHRQENHEAFTDATGFHPGVLKGTFAGLGPTL